MRLIYYFGGVEVQLRLYFRPDYCINLGVTKSGLHFASTSGTSLPPERLIQAGWKEIICF